MDMKRKTARELLAESFLELARKNRSIKSPYFVMRVKSGGR